MSARIKRNILIAAALLLLLGCASTALANSAQPPSVVIIVNNAPQDFALELYEGDAPVEGRRTQTAWETYYLFYSLSLHTDSGYALKVNAQGEQFTCALPQRLTGYDNVFTLDIARRTVTEGMLPYRSLLLVLLRVALTLLLEGAVFWLFGFRQKQSWTAFLVINLVTQGGLNLMLMGNTPIRNYVVLGLIALECFVFAIEIPAFIFAVKEHGKGRRALYAIVANLLSLVAGGWLLMVLPV